MGYKSDKSNPVTGDRITNALKGDKEKYRENWDKIFGKSSEDNKTEERDYSQEPWWKRAEDILDEVTRYNDRMSKDSDIEMGFYDE